MTLRDLAVAACVLAAFAAGQVDKRKRLGLRAGALRCALGKGAGRGRRASDG